MRAMRLIAAFLLIVVAASACQTATGQRAADTADDAKITASVKSKLVADKPSNLTRVDVDTQNGVVYLSGNVETAEQRTRAEQLAREASGVKRVENNLKVQRR